jgi:F-type H+-transporting ATPase subunit a
MKLLAAFCSLVLCVALLGAQQAVTLPAQDTSAIAAPAASAAAEHGAQTAHEPAAESEDFITPHIANSRYLELPYWRAPFHYKVYLPRWEPIHLGPITLDLSPTKHVVFLLLAAFLSSVVLITAAVAHRKHTHRAGAPKGFAAGIEALVLYLRNEVVIPNVGPHGERYVPFALTLFFFILFANLLGLMPWGATATGNISVTATLAIITFIVVEIAGMRALGRGYVWTVVYWSHDNPWYMNAPMTLIMTPVEIIGKFTKPFALAIRLFANMTAGHIILLALMGLFFSFVGSGGAGAAIAIAPLFMSVAIMMLEIFVAFLQAFIFALLASVFIGQIRTAHH